jgi:hypothetical protein
MRRLVSITACLGVSALLLASISPAWAARSVSFKDLYNKVHDTYLSVQSLADMHNAYVKHHHSKCSAGQKRKWTAKARNDMNTVLAVNKTLTGVTGKPRKKKIYHDLAVTVHDFKHWGATQVMPRLLKCKAMPDGSYTVEDDLYNVECDLGLCHY